MCGSGTEDINSVIIQSLTFASLPRDVAQKLINSITLPPMTNERIKPGYIVVGKGGSRAYVDLDQLLGATTQPNQSVNKRIAAQHFIGFCTLMLDGVSRINLVNEQLAGDLADVPQTSFQVLFQDASRRKEVQRITKDGLGYYLIVDPTKLGKLRLRLSSILPSSDMQEQGIHSDAVAYQKQAIHIDETSDGVKAFIGLVTEIVAGDPLILLIDEPEAFLHPTLSFVLGKEISRAMADSTKKLIASTHSSKFVMGCVQSGMPVTIVRLTFQNSVATARVLDSKELLVLMRHPLLRSTRVLESLFYEFVVVAESDADRAFYEEINERLLSYRPSSGISNCLFINAQNKQTIQAVLKPLRRIGIPTAAIVDIDVLKEGGKNWHRLMEAIDIPDMEKQSMEMWRAKIRKRLEEAACKDFKREGGLNLLEGEDKQAAEDFYAQLARYGLFLVKKGELESWLPHLSVSGHGPSWLIRVFEEMGDNPEAPNYITPSEGDVWHFMSSIKSWFTNTNRLGIPD